MPKHLAFAIMENLFAIKTISISTIKQSLRNKTKMIFYLLGRIIITFAL
jgi:hypothetical protein